MSTKGRIFKEITEHLYKEVPGIKWVDKDRGQLEDPQNFVFPRPAVFVSFGLTQYKSVGSGVQEGTAVIRIRTAIDNYADSHIGSINQDKALAFFEFNEQVHIALEGLKGSNFSKVTRTADEDDLDHTNMIITLMEYNCSIVDDSAKDNKNFILVTPDPELVVEKVKKENLPKKEVSSTIILP